MQIINMTADLPQHVTARWDTRSSVPDVFCVHHSATATTVTALQIARYHVGTKGMPSIQYHYVITAEGEVLQTQPDSAYVWHGNDWNTGLGVCLVGNFTVTHPTPAQIAAARWLLAEKRREYGDIRLVGHGEAPRASTACPGGTWLEWRDELEEKEVGTVAGSKIGIHFQYVPELGTEATELVRGSSIKWVKGINPDHWHAPAREMFPGKRVLGRFWIGGDNIERDQYVLRGAQGATDYMNMLAPRYAKSKADGCLDWLGPNEMHPNPETIAQHVDFWQRWAQLIVERYGARPWFGSFGVGWPNIGQIIAYRDVAVYCASKGGGMEVHEYGAPSVLDGDGWWTLRYRRTIAELGFEVPVIVGECGIDWGVTGQPPTGWNSHKAWVYPAQHGLPAGIINEDRYWRQLSAYDDELLNNDYVLAATPFVTCPGPDWATFDFGGSLIRRAVAKHNTGGMPPATLEQQIGDAVQAYIIPLNPNAALEKAGAALGLLPASDEVRDVAGYVAQAFRSPGEREWQHIAYCADGDWGNVKWFKRAN